MSIQLARSTLCFAFSQPPTSLSSCYDVVIAFYVPSEHRLCFFNQMKKKKKRKKSDEVLSEHPNAPASIDLIEFVDLRQEKLFSSRPKHLISALKNFVHVLPTRRTAKHRASRVSRFYHRRRSKKRFRGESEENSPI
jgi:hypothetical protein